MEIEKEQNHNTNKETPSSLRWELIASLRKIGYEPSPSDNEAIRLAVQNVLEKRSKIEPEVSELFNQYEAVNDMGELGEERRKYWKKAVNLQSHIPKDIPEVLALFIWERFGVSIHHLFALRKSTDKWDWGWYLNKLRDEQQLI